jgi:hypothetical protein
MTDQSQSSGPRFGRIRDAEQRSGLRRGALYALAAEHPGLFKKAGSATIIDLQRLDQVLASLPDAKLATV